jgi:hypothetical protein
MEHKTKKNLEYVHQELDKEVTALAGYYTPLEEIRIEYKGREVLCVTGVSVVESSCCGSGGCSYAIVPGYVLGWKSRKNVAGLPVTEVEPITDKAARQEIAVILKEKKALGNVEFW